MNDKLLKKIILEEIKLILEKQNSFPKLTDPVITKPLIALLEKAGYQVFDINLLVNDIMKSRSYVRDTRYEEP